MTVNALIEGERGYVGEFPDFFSRSLNTDHSIAIASSTVSTQVKLKITKVVGTTFCV